MLVILPKAVISALIAIRVFFFSSEILLSLREIYKVFIPIEVFDWDELQRESGVLLSIAFGLGYFIHIGSGNIKVSVAFQLISIPLSLHISNNNNNNISI